MFCSVREIVGVLVPMAMLARRGFPCACRKNVGSERLTGEQRI